MSEPTPFDVILSKMDAVLVLNVEPRERWMVVPSEGWVKWSCLNVESTMFSLPPPLTSTNVVRVEGKSVTESPPIRHDEKTSSPDETRKRGVAEQAESIVKWRLVKLCVED
ncbi:hypothetical protein BLNAU_21287 [Blattamonas nauphoetae]|uniref:Uncharacterized protein n=1 Tax=Blattamonas nauphoetae TaxID=2049346 RepID=A0ABQ9WYK4_9EUKA|nr:hypothetical protein BLNAU_21287 [Blattamonas nauphoetae]